MTFIQLVNDVCSRVGQTDSTSVARCRAFIQDRFLMLYDSRNWRDAIKNATITLVSGTSNIAVPTGIDRVIGININTAGSEHLLVPIDSPLAFQLNAAINATSGLPMAYEDYSDPDSPRSSDNIVARKIRFYPTPDQNYTGLLIGKRTLTNMSVDSDTPILRNVDNALIAYATGDMLERQRKRGAAQVKFQEASALLGAMVRQETEQSGNLPRIIPDVESRLEPNDYLMSKSDFA